MLQEQKELAFSYRQTAEKPNWTPAYRMNQHSGFSSGPRLIAKKKHLMHLLFSNYYRIFTKITCLSQVKGFLQFLTSIQFETRKH